MTKTKHNPKHNHTYTCDVCNKIATINIQNWWHKYKITPNNENFIEDDNWEGNTNEFWCNKCYEKSISYESANN